MTSSGCDYQRAMECDGIIEPKKLETLALDSFCGLLHTALDIAEEYYPLPSEGSGEDFPHRVRRLLGLDREFVLPSVVADELIGCFSAQEKLTSRILSAFCRSKIGTLRKVNIASCPDTSEEAFHLLLQHPLLELTLGVSESGNTLVWWRHMDNLVGSPAAATLSSLKINGVRKMYGPHVNDVQINSTFRWLKSLVSLNRLNLYRVYLSSRGAKALGQVAVQLPNLAVLNLAGTLILNFDASKSKVKALALSDQPVQDLSLQPHFSHILKMESLVSLDISSIQFASSDQEMAQKLSRLPNLRYLDLSGHRIHPSALDCFDPPHPRMSFLGLLSTGACGRAEYNCEVVSGDANEQQILVSLRTYSLRDVFLRRVLGQLWVFAEHGHLDTLQEELVMAILPLLERKYLPLIHLTSGCLWFLTKTELKKKLSTHTKKKAIVALVKLLEKDHGMGMQAIKNCVLCLSHYWFPEEVEFIFTRMLRVLIRLTRMRHNETVENLALHLMHDAMIEQSSPVEQKVLTKNLGGIKVAVECIENRVGRQMCDHALEAAWHFLRNVTDVSEAPENCAELINCGGLKVFVECFKMFTAKVLEGQQYQQFQDVIEGMVGALGNVTEVQHLRAGFVTSETMGILQSICVSVKNGIVQHNVTRLIANLAMEDDSLWEGVTPTKDHLLNIIENIVDNWDFGQQLNWGDITYRNLTPVIAVVNCPDERVALWGVWALNHLCHTDSTRYFPMLIKEGGVEAVENLMLRAKTDRVKKLASQVLALMSDDEDIEEDMESDSSPEEHKVLTRSFNKINVAVECIENEVESQKCDETLASAWDFLWSVTDEAPENCAELINCRGLKIFVECFKMIKAKLLEGQQYEDFQNVIKSMVGALGNIAQWQCHRASLINSELLNIFWSVCENAKNPGVQHVVTWLIANLAMEDDSLWEGVTPSKDHFLNMMEHIIDNWDFGQQPGCCYRCLTSIIAVVNCPDERVALCGVWALNHLCHIETARYFPMLIKEGGVEAVQTLMLRAKTDRVKRLASQVLALVSDNEDIEEDLDVKRRKLSNQ